MWCVRANILFNLISFSKSEKKKNVMEIWMVLCWIFFFEIWGLRFAGCPSFDYLMVIRHDFLFFLLFFKRFFFLITAAANFVVAGQFFHQWMHLWEFKLVVSLFSVKIMMGNCMCWIQCHRLNDEKKPNELIKATKMALNWIVHQSISTSSIGRISILIFFAMGHKTLSMRCVSAYISAHVMYDSIFFWFIDAYYFTIIYSSLFRIAVGKRCTHNNNHTGKTHFIWKGAPCTPFEQDIHSIVLNVPFIWLYTT